MGRETERKFLVTSTVYRNMATSRTEIRQGYLNRDPERTVRIRTRGDKGYITVKGLTSGFTRQEFEYEIPFQDASEMMGLCIPPLLEKTRYEVPYGGHVWEVDEFGGNLTGLTVAEVELPSEDTPVELPPFAGQEVTGDPRYYNSNLSAAAMP